MSDAGPWTTDDFEAMSWHDVHIHGFRLDHFQEGNGSSDLVLDIDYILRWEKSGDTVLFTVCRADLRFHGVFGLRFSVDYASAIAGMCPFSVDGIARRAVEMSISLPSYEWRLPINWPKGILEFKASGFTQLLTGVPRVQAGRQWLTPEERADPGESVGSSAGR